MNTLDDADLAYAIALICQAAAERCREAQVNLHRPEAIPLIRESMQAAFTPGEPVPTSPEDVNAVVLLVRRVMTRFAGDIAATVAGDTRVRVDADTLYPYVAEECGFAVTRRSTPRSPGLN